MIADLNNIIFFCFVYIGEFKFSSDTRQFEESTTKLYTMS